MTIRTKLLLIIPLLVLLANTVTLFLFQSSTVVQRGYDRMMDRVLAYREAVQNAERSTQSLYSYLLDPNPQTQAEARRQRDALLHSRERIGALGQDAARASTAANFLHLLDVLKRQQLAAESASGAESPSVALSLYTEVEQTEGFVREDGQRLIDLELSSDQPVFREIQLANVRMNRLGAAVIAIQTLLGVGLAFWVSRSVTEPVGRLVRMAKGISEGRSQQELEPLPPVTKDELGVMTGTFLQMVASLQEAAERDKGRLEQERLVKELELQSLQSQIQPHFLFNSLNVLSKLALLEGAERTSDLIVSMSKLIRYRLRKMDEPVTLREELGHVMEYVTIQRARFQNRVSFETDIDDTTLSAPIPALTIQPLVENAFVHGIEQLESGAAIRLSIHRDGLDVVVAVSDNGEGIDEETRQALLQLSYAPHRPGGGLEERSLAQPDQSQRQPKPSTGIGTRNVFRRLQLFSGHSENTVDIKSKIGEGTTVTIRIPWLDEGDKVDVSLADRGR
ncbi:integral membrane sensor signal transduction histidine kinase [Paenibacillus curdlanolyticus YK9]|uniref:histidine kinase n=1 Tax=Paenibacillus curdlanolyticus YK9 TaxID=717606 RepID=E0IA68_9BACL|nr:sensor histidine kinase [Paenibacillus curdlanolyticus]EFM10645.1 integral membrane sensor signal transduction histidine kinase [Paenibacillus curdlanolyticus YK9]